MDAMALPIAFDARRMRDELEQIEGALRWHVHPDYTVVARPGDWTAIALIASSQTDPDDPQSLRYRGETSGPTAVLAECPYFQEVIGTFRTEVHRARLMKLKPGADILPHRDYGEQRYSLIRGYIRVHIPVRTHPDVHFFVSGKRLPMTEGSAWYTNVCHLHAVRNDSDVDRVHLVLDMKVNDWVLGLFPPLNVVDRALGAMLVRYERPFLLGRFRLRTHTRQMRKWLGDLGLRDLKHRIMGWARHPSS